MPAVNSLKPYRPVDQLTDKEVIQLVHDWPTFARPEQLAPKGDWRTWLYLAGRGTGKTRTGAEWVREQIKLGARHVGLIAPTAADARKVMVEGKGEAVDSALLHICWKYDRDYKNNLIGYPVYEPSQRQLVWANGAVATTYSAEEPERLRGPAHSAIWADELAAWYDPESVWDMAMFGLRVGNNPRVMVSTTPKPIPLLRALLKDPSTVTTRGTTYDNRHNLAPAFFSTIIKKYEGTRLGRQELAGELLEEAEGALWNRAMIEKARLRGALPQMKRVVVGVDPAVTAKAESNLTGIVVAGLGLDGRGYILADGSGRFSPKGWADKAVALFQHFGADRFVAEGNQGGDMVRHTINSAMPNAPVTIVHASRGKQARAEPIMMLYEQGKVSHAAAFGELEDQMCTWEPLGDLPSPDRIDAMVWALTALFINVPQQAVFGTYGQV